jgi:hypothetical protein
VGRGKVAAEILVGQPTAGVLETVGVGAWPVVLAHIGLAVAARIMALVLAHLQLTEPRLCVIRILCSHSIPRRF